ncbi:KDEL (Lys-Asp-Glu-Leu) endoplasmic reticulum protein retention receptor 1 [Cricetulus griseus]
MLRLILSATSSGLGSPPRAPSPELSYRRAPLPPSSQQHRSSGAARPVSLPPAQSCPSSPVMNLFRFLGDLSHLLAIILLLLKIWKSRSCAGISGKSQVLFAVVFTARYLDLFTNYISLYNTCMKVVYIACSFTTVWMIYSKFKATYDGNHDTFRVEFLVVPTAILAFLVNHDFTPLEFPHCEMGHVRVIEFRVAYWLYEEALELRHGDWKLAASTGQGPEGEEAELTGIALASPAFSEAGQEEEEGCRRPRAFPPRVDFLKSSPLLASHPFSWVWGSVEDPYPGQLRT